MARPAALDPAALPLRPIVPATVTSWSAAAYPPVELATPALRSAAGDPSKARRLLPYPGVLSVGVHSRLPIDRPAGAFRPPPQGTCLGAAINGYQVNTYDATNGAYVGDVSVCGTCTSASVGGLTNGHPYYFVVYATNTAGYSPASAASNSVTPAPPGRSHGGDGHRRQRLGHGHLDRLGHHGSPVTNYTVTSNPGSLPAPVHGEHPGHSSPGGGRHPRRRPAGLERLG